MTSDKDLLHGAALYDLLGAGRRLHLQLLDSSGVYLVEDRNISELVVLKYSTAPRSPWQFTFGAGDEDLLESLSREHPGSRIYYGLICNKHGVCRLSVEDLEEMGLVRGRLAGRAVSVSRPARGQFHLSGPDRKQLHRAIPKSAWAREGGSSDA